MRANRRSARLLTAWRSLAEARRRGRSARSAAPSRTLATSRASTLTQGSSNRLRRSQAAPCPNSRYGPFGMRPDPAFSELPQPRLGTQVPQVPVAIRPADLRGVLCSCWVGSRSAYPLTRDRRPRQTVQPGTLLPATGHSMGQERTCPGSEPSHDGTQTRPSFGHHGAYRSARGQYRRGRRTAPARPATVSGRPPRRRGHAALAVVVAVAAFLRRSSNISLV